MATITVSNQIDAPVAEVFGRFTDLDGSATRVSGIKAIEMLTPGPFGPGTRWRETREVLGQLDTAEMEVTARRNDLHDTQHKLARRATGVHVWSMNGGTRRDRRASLTDRPASGMWRRYIDGR